MSFDFVETHQPVNVTALRVTAFKGVHYDPEIKSKCFLSDIPQKIYKPEELKKIMKISPMFFDFTGHKQGRLTIVGMCQKKGKESANWLAKCSCGKYTTRSTLSIKRHIKNKEKYDEDMCEECFDLRRIRRLDAAKLSGLSYKEYCDKHYPRNPIEKLDPEPLTS